MYNKKTATNTGLWVQTPLTFLNALGLGDIILVK